MSTLLIKNVLMVTMNPQNDIVQGDLLIKDRHIADIGTDITVEADAIFDASQLIALPGFIQTHVHLCQALFRNTADDLSLLDWLSKKIWPMEAKHTEHSTRISARLGLAELMTSGTTTIMDFGSVHYQDIIFQEIAAAGMRAVSGKTMMNYGNCPENLKESTQKSIDDSIQLMKKWNGYDNGRIHYALTPRFVLSNSDDLLQEVGRLANDYGVIIHTHASENKHEVDAVIRRYNRRNIEIFDDFGLTDNHLCLAHCVWTDENERRILHEKNIHVLHCPSANLKLGSGIAPIPAYLDAGVNVSLGADGPPCNNQMNIFREMYLASLIQKPIHGPQAMSAADVLRMATINGARALGLEKFIGSLEIGKIADITFLDQNTLHSIPGGNILSKIVYSINAADVQRVMIDGRWVKTEQQLHSLDEQEVMDAAKREIKRFSDI
ncbi:MAG: 5'-deoxyadenosine deaminase [Caldithrix sp.]|nr:5'-deoxyadenosine deaminase [Caldithrix sp.]